MLEIINYLKARYLSEKGQGMVEYAVVLAGVAAIAAIVFAKGGDLATAIKTMITQVSTTVSGIGK